MVRPKKKTKSRLLEQFAHYLRGELQRVAPEHEALRKGFISVHNEIREYRFALKEVLESLGDDAMQEGITPLA